MFKVLTGILAILVVTETAYMLAHRRSIHRFQPVAVEEWSGSVAFDTATGRICRTLELIPADPARDDDTSRFAAKLRHDYNIFISVVRAS